MISFILSPNCCAWTQLHEHCALAFWAIVWNLSGLSSPFWGKDWFWFWFFSISWLSLFICHGLQDWYSSHKTPCPLKHHLPRALGPRELRRVVYLFRTTHWNLSHTNSSNIQLNHSFLWRVKEILKLSWNVCLLRWTAPSFQNSPSFHLDSFHRAFSCRRNMAPSVP